MRRYRGAVTMLVAGAMLAVGCGSDSDPLPSLAQVSPSPVYPSNTLAPGSPFSSYCPIMTVVQVGRAIGATVVSAEEQDHVGFKGCQYETAVKDQWVRVLVAGPFKDTTVEQAVSRPFHDLTREVEPNKQDLQAYYGTVERLTDLGDVAYFGTGGPGPRLLVAGRLEGSSVRVVRLEAGKAMSRSALISLARAVLERV